MTLQNSKSHQEENNEANEIKTKMISTQDVIKNKFSKAYANRIEQEKKLKQTMRSLLAVSSTHSRAATTSTKTTDNKNNKGINHIHFSFNNPNELCERLRKLILIMNEDDVKQVEEMNAIINKLRELEILV